MSWVVGSVRSEAFREIFLRFHQNIPGVTVTVRMGGEGKKGRCHCQLVLGRTDGYHGTGARKASERKILNKNEMDGYVHGLGIFVIRTPGGTEEAGAEKN